MNIRPHSLVLVSLLASAGCSAVLPAVPQLSTSGGSSVLAQAASKGPTKRQIFTAWDTNQDGSLSLAEYEAGFLAALQPAPTPAQLPAVKQAIDAEFSRLDRNGDGRLTFSEFRKPTANQLGQIAPGDVLSGNAFLVTSTSTDPAAA